MNDACPDLEALFTELEEGAGPALEHAKSCEACSAVVAEHRAMERDLFRLSDPLPPASFVPAVMAKIAASPQPARREVWAGLAVLAVALTASAAALLGRPDAFGHMGVVTAQAARTSAAMAFGAEQTLSAVWHHAAFPVMALLGAVLMGSLFGLKKLAGSNGLADMKVAP